MITNEEVKKIAKLSRLNFEAEKIPEFTAKLTKIVDMLDILNEVDCSSVVPLTSVCEMQQRLRKDEVTSEDISEELFNNLDNRVNKIAKEVKCFVVPKVVE